MFHRLILFFYSGVTTRVGLSLLNPSCVGDFKHAVLSLTHPSAKFSLQFYFNFFPKMFVQIVVKTTMLIELKGIKIAATTGANCPVTAKYKPILL